MSLGTALSSALSGLQIYQQQIDVTSNNVANVGTEGYTKKVLPQSTAVAEGQAIGVSGDTIIRKVDFNLVMDIFTQVSDTNYLSTKISFLEDIQNFHGSPDSETAISSYVSQLKDKFTALADAPEDGLLIRETINQAVKTANKINDLGDMLQEMRNDAQADIKLSVDRINDLLDQIAKLNDQIRTNTNLDRSIATFSDKRDLAVKELSQEMDISFFIRADNVMVVQTSNGVELTSDRASPIFFKPLPIGATHAYGDDQVAGLYTQGDPEVERNAIDITSHLKSGKIGGLLELRDDILPSYMAQIDELAHKLATRFDSQGLRLFTDISGSIPSDSPPDPFSDPVQAVDYIGFSQSIQVNPLVLENNSLIRSGTISHDEQVQTGSNEVIKRIIENAFGNVYGKRAEGTRDLYGTGTGIDADRIQNLLGLYSENEITGNRDLSSYASVTDLISASDGLLDPPNDSFTIIFGGTDTITLDLSDAELVAGANAADQMVTYINSQIAALPVDPTFGAAASIGNNGELALNARVQMQISGTGGIGDTGLQILGLSEMTQEATDPYFDIQVGNQPLKRITIAPTDFADDLVEKMRLDTSATPGDSDGVAGLTVREIDVVNTTLAIRPGDGNATTYSDFKFGGDLKIFGGPFETDATSPLGANVGIIEALFGMEAPIYETQYGSETYQNTVAGTSSGVFEPFRQNYLGADVAIDIGITGSANLIDFSQKLVNRQTEDMIIAEASMEDEETFLNILERQFLDEAGVNLDEEMSNIIIIQNAYASSARIMNTINQMFEDLLSAV